MRTKQVRTVAQLRLIGDKIDKTIAQQGNNLNQELATEIVSHAGEGDAWGNPIHVWVRTSHSKFSYVLVSYGSDGRPDTRDVAAYFTIPSTPSRFDATQDIIYRDGELITHVGK